MLDKNDLRQIRDIVKTEVKSIVKTEVKNVVKTEVKNIVKTEVKTEVRNELKPVKSSLAEIRRELSDVIEFFDNDVSKLRSRVDRIEEHLHLSTLKPSF